MTQNKPIFRQDYQPFPFALQSVSLHFALQAQSTIVRSQLSFALAEPADLYLHGEQVRLRAITIDGAACSTSNYQVTEQGLTIPSFAGGLVEIEVEIDPSQNTELSGLYQSGPLLCTQCEAEGFRRITFFPDRPDVLTVFTTTLVADPAVYPILLANGNKQSQEVLADGRLQVTWHDPHPKPCYLFALVAGDLHCHAGSYVTAEGREVALEILVEHRNKDLCGHALWSLQESMRWDEQRYGRCYDLDVYMIVAVDDFNMGAMENKGLNIFNAKYVLASPDTATDDDFQHVAAVIAHEYFHNWTGNRVTCRDWFQLTLKEGLTVFRDQQFTADHTSAAVKRIDDVRLLRSHQFPEDAGPQRHPIRPEQYVVMDNFYTVTVYEKGAEVIRMCHTLLGEAGFRRGMDLYFERHDGMAVTCDDFRAAMADANADLVAAFDPELRQFEWWYRQAGTPLVQVSLEMKENHVVLRLTQDGPVSGGLDSYQAMVIPLRLAFIGQDGTALTSRMNDQEQHEHLVIFNQYSQEISISFPNVDLDSAPVLSFLRNFSAPVRVEFQQEPADLLTLAAYDTDPFNRWQAGQTLALQAIQACLHGAALAEQADAVVQVWRSVLNDHALEAALQARAIQLPTVTEILPTQTQMDFAGTQAAVRRVRCYLRDHLRTELLRTYHACREAAGTSTTGAVLGQRRLAMVCLGHLGCDGDSDALQLAKRQFDEQLNMTEVQAALAVLVQDPHGQAAEQPLAAFHQQWRSDPLVLDKWFAVQAGADTPDAVERVATLCEHPDFTLSTPNRVRSVLGVFASGNLAHFHRADGAGYQLLGKYLQQLCTKNPQLAARLTGAFNQWRRSESSLAAKQRQQLQDLRVVPGCAADVLEVIDRALQDDG
jgi:aminopeptidase N